jgi:hypothetical protein
MAIKKRKPAAEAQQPPASDEPSQVQRFEKELKDLAARAENDGAWGGEAARQARLVLKALALLALLGIYSNVSQLNLSPVYGSIPAALGHTRLVIAGCFVGWAGNLFLWRMLPFSPDKLLPLFALWVPTVQFFLFMLSNKLTTTWGPNITEGLTLFPIAVVTAASVATYLDGVDLSMLPKQVSEAAPGIVSWTLFRMFESTAGSLLPGLMGKSFLLTRVSLEMLLAIPYVMVASSYKMLLFATPALIHTALFNTHVSLPTATSALQESLAGHDFKLLARQESLTGYISVLEHVSMGYRVMRCDHSLLGGNWIKYKTPTGVPEPIYAVFVMLEAIRLVRTPQPIIDEEASALVIGLGIGTTPTALIAHGIDTTIVEIDPVVHEFASDYFGLPGNHTPVVEDAVSFTHRLATTTNTKYDYIVHDVFTGGAEPVQLFTLEFLQGLSSLLKPNGVIAINYAGDFFYPPIKIIMQTIHQVFPSCRAYRESARNETAIAEEGRDFTNVVIFCVKRADEIKFRLPRKADLLGTISRKTYMFPVHEVTDSDFVVQGHDGVVLRRNDTKELDKWQRRSAVGHWEVMRTVLPPVAWEMW